MEFLLIVGLYKWSHSAILKVLWWWETSHDLIVFWRRCSHLVLGRTGERCTHRLLFLRSQSLNWNLARILQSPSGRDLDEFSTGFGVDKERTSSTSLLLVVVNIQDLKQNWVEWMKPTSHHINIGIYWWLLLFWTKMPRRKQDRHAHFGYSNYYIWKHVFSSSCANGSDPLWAHWPTTSEQNVLNRFLQ